MISLKGCLKLPFKFPVVSHVEYKFRRRPSIIYHNHVQHSHDSHDSMVQVKHSKCCQPFQGLHGNLKTFPELSESLLCVHISIMYSSYLLCLRFTIAFDCQKQQEYYEISINANFLCEMNLKQTPNWNRNASKLTDTRHRHRHGWPKRSNYGRKQNWA